MRFFRSARRLEFFAVIASLLFTAAIFTTATANQAFAQSSRKSAASSQKNQKSKQTAQKTTSRKVAGNTAGKKTSTATNSGKTTALNSKQKRDQKTASSKAKSTSKNASKTQASGKQTSSKADKNARTSRDAKKSGKNAPASAKNNASAKNSRLKDTADNKKLSARERRALERKKAEEARRAAILEEKRRREEAARIARERKLAFERSLHTETETNIAADNTDGEDPELRKVAIEALGDRAGTVVVMEAKTGRILTMVNQDWAIRKSFKPCSTIKLVTGVAGLNEHVINQDGRIGESTSGIDLDSAVARSNNGYFQRVGSQIGNQKIIEYARDLGLGQPTGINAAGEAPGKLPFGNNHPRIYSHGDDFEVTPLQLAVMVSAIANGGQRVVPQIVKEKDTKKFRPKYSGSIPIEYRTVQGILPGMIGTSEYGTAHRGTDSSLGIAGKTGSCIFAGSWIGLFASVAPVEDPQYSVVVITRGESERGKYAAAVAGQIYRALAPKIHRNLARFAEIKSIRPAPSPEALATADEDEVDEADENTQRTITVGRPNSSEPEIQKKVKKTSSTKPVFPPVIIEYDKNKTTESRPRIVKP
ncbi:MAG TPA: penicillin-binding transpeptidase domain-containing protein [Pyrinomonadaceae bacterium]|nr:penicillin-binding transpeptidase domain-containing protein [Pyrinomonadaceae bacterium]